MWSERECAALVNADSPLPTVVHPSNQRHRISMLNASIHNGIGFQRALDLALRCGSRVYLVRNP